MPSNTIIQTPPRVPLLDTRTGGVSREWYLYFNDTRRKVNATGDSSVLTIGDLRNDLPNSVALTVTDGELVGMSGDGFYALGLADTAVTAGTYGDAANLVSLGIDAKGRIVAASEVALNTDNVTEGALNLYFTVARARNSLTGSTGITYTAGTGTITLADTAVTPGTYGSANKSARITLDQQGRATAATEQTITVAAVAGATPAADGTYPLPTSITIVNGIITAIS